MRQCIAAGGTTLKEVSVTSGNYIQINIFERCPGTFLTDLVRSWGNENNSNKNAGDVLGFANTRNSGGVCSTVGSIPPTKARSEKPRNRT